MKNKKIVIILPVLIIVLTILLYIYRQKQYVGLDTIKEYVQQNNEYLTEVSQQLLDTHGDEDVIATYRHKREIPKDVNINKLYKDLRVYIVYVMEKKCFDDEDCVQILLKNKNGNFWCGIYYSPSGKLLEHGAPKEGDIYEFDGSYTGDKYIYRSEKICDNWYYYEEDRW